VTRRGASPQRGSSSDWGGHSRRGHVVAPNILAKPASFKIVSFRRSAKVSTDIAKISFKISLASVSGVEFVVTSIPVIFSGFDKPPVAQIAVTPIVPVVLLLPFVAPVALAVISPIIPVVHAIISVVVPIAFTVSVVAVVSVTGVAVMIALPIVSVSPISISTTPRGRFLLIIVNRRRVLTMST
jgi:hypothetical protein